MHDLHEDLPFILEEIAKAQVKAREQAGVSKNEMRRRGVSPKTLASIESGSAKMTVAGLLCYRAALNLNIFQELL